MAIKELLETTVADGSSPLNDVKVVYFGDPVQIPESNLPALTVQPVSTEYELRGSRYDEKIHVVNITLVYNQKSYYRDIVGDPSMEADKVYAVEDSVNKVEKTGTDRDTAPLTVCGTIQQNTSLPWDDSGTPRQAADLAQVSNVEYLFSRERGFPTYEVVTTVRARLIGDR